MAVYDGVNRALDTHRTESVVLAVPSTRGMFGAGSMGTRRVGCVGRGNSTGTERVVEEMATGGTG